MTEAAGWVQANIDVNRDFSTKIKPQFHRAGLTFRLEGFLFTMNKETQVDGVDYTALKHTASLTVAVNAGDTVITVSDITGFVKSKTVVLTESGGTPTENKVIRDINVSAKQLTLTNALSNSYTTSATVAMDRVTVSYNPSTKLNTISWCPAGQNSDSLLSGVDLQNAMVYIDTTSHFHNFDKCESRIIVPYWTGASWIEISATWMVRSIWMTQGIDNFVFDSHESATAIDPNYILRMWFTSGEETPTEKKISVVFGSWRA